MSYLRFTSTYYNTTGAATTWKAEIYDRDTSPAQVYNFESAGPPEVRYSGLPQDLKPGIYPTEYTIGMFIRTSPKIRGGVTYGPTASILSDLFTSSEGRFILKLYKNDVVIFIGIILPDQCSYEDAAEPYILSIQAADGLYRLQTEDYVSVIGTINYVTLRRVVTESWAEFSPTLVTTGNVGFPTTLTGTEWIAIEHESEKKPADLLHGRVSWRNTTYARYEQYQVDSPGTGWVDQGGGLWAKELDYFNEIIVNETSYYHLTRDIDNTPFRTLDEYIARGMAVIPCKDEYGVDCMYDIVDTWYETGMYDLTKCPTEMMRVSERKLAVGNKWFSILEDIVKMKYMRLYYSDGRYHFEQISERGETTVDRYRYNKDGTFIDLETDVDLDIDYDTIRTDGAGTASNGSFKFLAPLKAVRVKTTITGSNLLENVKWSLGSQGSVYLGRIKKKQASVHFGILVRFNAHKEFYIGGLAPAFYQAFVDTATRVRVTNIETGITYHLTPEAVDNLGASTWETTAAAGVFTKTITFPGITELTGNANFDLRTTSADLPGDLNDSFDVYVSVNMNPYLGPFGAFWTEANPTAYKLTCETEKESFLITIDDDGNQVDSEAEKIYEVTNDVDNSLTVEYDAKFCDTGLKDDSIEIKSSGAPISWRKSRKWNRNGEVTGSVELLLLLAQEIMSLRTVPLRIFSGSFLTSEISTQNRISRLTYIYLPLSVTINTDVDEISGDFVNIARTTPPDGDVLEIPIAGGDLFGPADISTPSPDIPGSDPIPMGFTTNEIITATDTLTQCDIVNTDGVFCQTGSVIMVLNVETGDTENVKLTQDINPTDTVMYFESHTFVYSFPTLAPLSLVGDIVTIPTNTNQLYYFFKMSHTATTIYAPNFTFVDPEIVTPNNINKRYQVWRGGVKMTCDFSPGTDADRRLASYYFDGTAHTWIFYDDGLENEMILIIAY